MIRTARVVSGYRRAQRLLASDVGPLGVRALLALDELMGVRETDLPSGELQERHRGLALRLMAFDGRPGDLELLHAEIDALARDMDRSRRVAGGVGFGASTQRR